MCALLLLVGLEYLSTLLIKPSTYSKVTLSLGVAVLAITLLVITNKKIKHGIACSLSHGLYDLVSEGQNSGVVDDNSVQGLRLWTS